ncbi:hypothetical protein LX69_01737 [Breznakibacter xylanolyticus]|uniref:Uncharacterized protein n=1 Tax=Breznakibacter xylanolyticus TaxID=990 RepID=A0A2W7NEV1_9BACT|nr:hypothetical protein LX69_01737 [Breznakibacter xylanolyticus]
MTQKSNMVEWLGVGFVVFAGSVFELLCFFQCRIVCVIRVKDKKIVKLQIDRKDL